MKKLKNLIYNKKKIFKYIIIIFITSVLYFFTLFLFAKLSLFVFISMNLVLSINIISFIVYLKKSDKIEEKNVVEIIKRIIQNENSEYYCNFCKFINDKNLNINNEIGHSLIYRTISFSTILDIFENIDNVKDKIIQDSLSKLHVKNDFNKFINELLSKSTFTQLDFNNIVKIKDLFQQKIESSFGKFIASNTFMKIFTAEHLKKWFKFVNKFKNQENAKKDIDILNVDILQNDCDLLTIGTVRNWIKYTKLDLIEISKQIYAKDKSFFFEKLIADQEVQTFRDSLSYAILKRVKLSSENV